MDLWIKGPSITAFVICLLFIGTTHGEPTFCAYRDDSYTLNKTVGPPMHDGHVADFYQYLERQWQRHRGVFKVNGYEQCPDTEGTSHCYTLWLNPSSGQEKPVVVKQGCWNNPTTEVLEDCRASRCRFSTSDTTRVSQLNYCCCTGNKCNDDNHTDIVTSQGKAPYKAISTQDNQRQEDKGKDGKNGLMMCSFKSPESVAGKMTEKNGMGIIQPDGKATKCPPETNYCFTYYQVDQANKSKLTIKYQGCWNDQDDKGSCDSSQCIPYVHSYHSHKQNNSHFCCCYGNMCNNNISTDVVPMLINHTTDSSGPVTRHLRDPSYKERTIMISLLSVFSLAIVVLVLYLVYRFCLQPPRPPNTATSSTDDQQTPAFDIDDLKISCLITKGRYSEVWKGSLQEQDVAVKIYSPAYKQYYYNEKYIYSLPHMEHDNVIKFFGGEEKILEDGSVQHLLVLEYVPDGTLVNYLKNNTLDWFTMCKMCQTLARGMSHLHTDQGSGESFKATVAHRDLNSRNVLIKPDLSCVIADLGFCMTAMGSKLIQKGRTENAEQTSLTDVGTLRYMAPELLDGAVNLRDCEASLKQIDMYSFGLVMWEIASRCSELYQGCPMPEFGLPYQAEAGNHPTFEEMQLLVSRNKVRPKFPEVWKEYNQAVRALKETIEECWDQDAEARLTALCVEERIVEMKTLWTHDSRNKANKGMTPTINTALLTHPTQGPRPGYNGSGHTQWGGLSSTSDSTAPNVVAEGNTSGHIINDIRNSTGLLRQSESTSALSENWNGERRGSFSTSTMETTLAVTPADSLPSHPKSQNINAMMNQPVPRNQGRNPITERNTHKRSDEELAVVGNNLLYGKDQNGPDQSRNTDSILESFTDSLETSLMQHDSLNHNRSPPSTHNHNQQNINPGTRTELPPKVFNNPDTRHEHMNGGKHLNRANISSNNKTATPKVVKKSKDIGILGHIALFGKLAFGGRLDRKRSSSESDNAAGRMESGRVYESGGRQNPMFEPSQTFETEVRITNNGPVVRPAQLQNKVSNLRNVDTSHSNVNRDIHRFSLEIESQDSSDPELQSDSPIISRHRVAPYSKSTSDLSPEKTCGYSKLEDDSKQPRPSTLSLKGHNYARSGNGSMNSLSKVKGMASQKGSNTGHEKRPLLNGYKVTDNSTHCHKSENIDSFENKDDCKALFGINARFSLHDDRLMSDSSKNLGGESSDCRTSSSLNQFKSIDESAPTLTDCTC